MSAPVTIPAALAADVLDVVHRDARRAQRAHKRAEHRWSIAPSADADDARAEAERLGRQAERLAALAAALTAAIAEPAASVEALTR